MEQQTNTQLKETVRFLGSTLGDTISAQLGQEWLQRIEDIRISGRESFNGDEDCSQKLKALFSEISNEELLTVGRAFSQFLNLANIAEQEFNSSNSQDDPVQRLFDHLESANIDNQSFENALQQLKIDLVLTAHPTEVTRRTLIHKHSELASCLREIHQAGITDFPLARETQDIRRFDVAVNSAGAMEQFKSIQYLASDRKDFCFRQWSVARNMVFQCQWLVRIGFDNGLRSVRVVG